MIENRPRVSIGLPVYNGERFLVEAIESVLNQTLSDFELIISDNASTDRTEQICRDYAARERLVGYLVTDRADVIRNTGVGATAERNRPVVL